MCVQQTPGLLSNYRPEFRGFFSEAMRRWLGLQEGRHRLLQKGFNGCSWITGCRGVRKSSLDDVPETRLDVVAS